MLISHPPTPKKFLTNQGENILSKRLERILPLTQDFDCLVGYFFISGFFRLYLALESVKKVRILIGLKNEQVVHGLVQIANDDSGENAPSTAEVKRTFAGMLRTELTQAQDLLAIETGIRTFIEWIRSDKLEVKLYREQNIHAKVYIMTPEHPVPDVSAVLTSTLQSIPIDDFHCARYQPLNPLHSTGPIEARTVQSHRNLATFMGKLFVKRLESSFYAFPTTTILHLHTLA